VIRVIDLDVAPDISRLKKMIHDLLPEEAPNIKVMANQDSIVLSGTVKDAATVQKVLSLAEVYAPKEQGGGKGGGQGQGGGQAGNSKVVNLLSVGGVQQIMLEVRVAEMSKSVINRMGININAIGDGNFAYTLLGSLTSVSSSMFDVESATNVYQYITSSDNSAATQVKYSEFTPSTSKTTATMNQGTAVARWNTNWGGTGNVTWTGVLDMLKENGLVRILAEPNLVCLNGQAAEFLAGGQIPIPVSAGLGSTTIEWKKFGVQLSFTPTLVAGERINLKVSPEVSNLDYTRAITLSGATIPAISTRQTSTTVELKNGQSFAVAGMLSESSRNAADKYPLLGDIPVLGNLFKSSAFQKDQTELVIIITAHLVKPLEKKATVLPTDTAHEPDDLEFFLGIARNDAPQARTGAQSAGGGGLDGDFGHVVPVAASTKQPGYAQ